MVACHLCGKELNSRGGALKQHLAFHKKRRNGRGDIQGGKEFGKGEMTGVRSPTSRGSTIEEVTPTTTSLTPSSSPPASQSLSPSESVRNPSNVISTPPPPDLLDQNFKTPKKIRMVMVQRRERSPSSSEPNPLQPEKLPVHKRPRIPSPPPPPPGEDGFWIQTPEGLNSPDDHQEPFSFQYRDTSKRFFPFSCEEEFKDAENAIQSRMGDNAITKMFGSRCGYFVKNARDLHNFLDEFMENKAKFRPEQFDIDGKTFTCYVRPITDLIRDVLLDQNVLASFIWEPQIKMGRINGQEFRVFEDFMTSDSARKFYAETHAKGSSLVYLQIASDKKNLTHLGSVAVHPVYLWIGNIPSLLRSKGGYFGAQLIALLPVIPKAPEAEKESEKHKRFRRQIRQKSLSILVDLLREAEEIGVSTVCGDGVFRSTLARVGCTSLDLEEIYHFLFLKGALSKHNCPKCLRDKDTYGNSPIFNGVLRTAHAAREIYIQVGKCRNQSRMGAEGQALLDSWSFYREESPFFQLVSDPFDAIASDPLHQLRKMFVDHVLKPLARLLPPEKQQIFDKRMINLPFFPGVRKVRKHGVCDVTFYTHMEVEDILRRLLPQLLGLLPPKIEKELLPALRTMFFAMLLSQLPTHTLPGTLNLLEAEINKVAELQPVYQKHLELSQTMPKMHIWLNHYVQGIIYHGSTSHTTTAHSEKEHTNLQSDFDISNRRDGEFQEALIRFHQERLALSKIRSDSLGSSRTAIDNENDTNNAEDEDMEKSNVDFKGRIRVGACEATMDQKELIEEAKLCGLKRPNFALKQLRDFVGKLENQQNPRLIQISRHRVFRVKYSSAVDWRESEDIIRSVSKWRQDGERRDDVLWQDGNGGFGFARILRILTVETDKRVYNIGLVRNFQKLGVNFSTGMMELEIGEAGFMDLGNTIRGCCLEPDPRFLSHRFVNDLIDYDWLLRIFRLLQQRKTNCGAGIH